MRTKTNRIWTHFVALGASVVVNAALVEWFLASKTNPWPSVFADASARPAAGPSVAATQASPADRIERVVVIAKRAGPGEGFASAQAPVARSGDCPVRL